MDALHNVHVNQLDTVVNGEFNMLNVSQVITATDSVFREMSKELNIDNDCMIKQAHLNKRTVPKEKLAEWLETVCYILDSFSVPLLKNAVRVQLTVVLSGLTNYRRRRLMIKTKSFN